MEEGRSKRNGTRWAKKIKMSSEMRLRFLTARHRKLFWGSRTVLKKPPVVPKRPILQSGDEDIGSNLSETQWGGCCTYVRCLLWLPDWKSSPVVSGVPSYTAISAC